MIRAQLRLLGRFLIELKKINSEITDFSSLYDSKYYRSAIEAVNVVAGLDEEKGIYKTPANASSLGTFLKKVGLTWKAECIASHDKIREKNCKNFLTLYEDDYLGSVNKTVMETQVMNRRQKKIDLPQTEDIKILSNYVEKQVEDNWALLEKGFSEYAWRDLAEATLIYIQVFNRKRAGELERLLISDFKNKQSVPDDDETYHKLSKSSQQVAKQYVRIEIRGKLNRVVPILLNLKMHDSIGAFKIS